MRTWRGNEKENRVRDFIVAFRVGVPFGPGVRAGAARRAGSGRGASTDVHPIAPGWWGARAENWRTRSAGLHSGSAATPARIDYHGDPRRRRRRREVDENLAGGRQQR